MFYRLEAAALITRLPHLDIHCVPYSIKQRGKSLLKQKPDPNGPLSENVPPTAIAVANMKVNVVKALDQ